MLGERLFSFRTVAPERLGSAAAPNRTYKLKAPTPDRARAGCIMRRETWLRGLESRPLAIGSSRARRALPGFAATPANRDNRPRVG